MLNKIEKSIFFPIVRIVSFVFALILLIGMIAGIIFIDPAMKYFIILMIGFGFLVFTTVVMLLLLLSIERNTR